VTLFGRGRDRCWYPWLVSSQAAISRYPEEEEDAELLCIPNRVFQKYPLDKHCPERLREPDAVQRSPNRTQVLESVTFNRVTGVWPLAFKFFEAENSATLHVTHEQIAVELGRRARSFPVCGGNATPGLAGAGKKRIKIVTGLRWRNWQMMGSLCE
jgi:hypothetical protein